MKTKTNKVPLVGPRGRRELLDRIEELENKVAELASNQPEKHVLEILSVSDGSETIEETLARIKLDGRGMTTEDLNKLGVLNTYLLYNGVEYAITQYLYNDYGTSVYAIISAGFASIVQEVEKTLEIQLDSNATTNSFIHNNER